MLTPTPEIRFLQDEKPAGLQEAVDMGECCDGIGLVHEDESAHHRVERFGGREAVDCRFLECDMRELRSLCRTRAIASTAGFTSIPTTEPVGPTSSRSEEADVANAAAEIQDAHPRGDTGLLGRPVPSRTA